MEIEELLNTAHIHFNNGVLLVYVADINKYKVLFEPEGDEIEKGIILESNAWKQKLRFPDFVIDVSPKWSEGCLRVWVTEGYDLEILSNWLKTF